VRELIVTATKEPIVLDGALELVWLREAGQLQVVDLRVPAPTRITIGQRVPGKMPLVVDRQVDQKSAYVEATNRDGCISDALLTLTWDVEPELKVEREGGELPADRRVKLVGGAWLNANLQRSGGAHPEPLDLGGEGPRATVEMAVKVRTCDSGDDGCGRTVDFGETGWQLMVVQSEHKSREGIEGCNYLRCLLYDPKRPKTEAFASPLAPLVWKRADAVAPAACGSFLFDRSGRFYLSASSVCSVTKGCSDAGGEAIGWLPPGTWIVGRS
jgi:hypothetical protein